MALQGDEGLPRTLAKKCKEAREKIHYLALHAPSKG